MLSFVYLRESRGGYNVGKTELRYGRRNVFDIQIMNFIQAVLRRELPDRNTIDDSIMSFMRTHGQTEKYFHTMLGLNYRMADVEAAIGREQLKCLDNMLALRRRNAILLNEGLENLPGIRPQKMTPETEHAWHQYCVVVDKKRFGFTRDQLAEALKKKGISTAIHYPRGLHQQPIFEALYGKRRLRKTEYLAENILALPVHHGLSEGDVYTVVEAVQKVRSE
jgi:perosamine synthetase